nr:MAG TPA: hypothetical protein [Caudoviricetes sp.]
MRCIECIISRESSCYSFINYIISIYFIFFPMRICR